jgi:hypothetical protein
MRSAFVYFGIMLPAALFTVYVLLAVIGCLANMFGAGEAFYCGVYCKMALFLFVSLIGIALYIKYHYPRSA